MPDRPDGLGRLRTRERFAWIVPHGFRFKARPRAARSADHADGRGLTVFASAQMRGRADLTPSRKVGQNPRTG
ncbi:hypothetical protein, partial [Streptomyces alfalfae]|uniref:hypothetical protein n=1 Tax=Streptomyces alfalfae TaxID=1642299 RepID=UPI002811FE6C